jgi:N-acetyl-D-muramate 6-phosphate phosphatase
MLSTREQAVLFDLDGTLIDTAPDMAAALNSLLAEQDSPALSFDQVRPFVSHGANAMIRLGFPQVPEQEFNQLRERFLNIYRDNLVHDTCLFPGMEQLLTQLEAAAIPWGIVTNKPTWLTEPLLEQLQLRQRMGSLVCGDTFPERKPHPRPMLHAASELGIKPQSCLYLGDAERDIVAARAAGMRSLVARFCSLGVHDQPENWGAEGHIDNPSEVLQWLA